VKVIVIKKDGDEDDEVEVKVIEKTKKVEKNRL
jgi:hypothetical protein